MSISLFERGFLFRRIAGLTPCVLPAVGKGGLAIENKWQLASARDVLISAHYWRLFEHLHEPPSLIVDLGAHCGHFIVLIHCLVAERFGSDAARYYAVEGLQELLPSLESTLRGVGLHERVTIIHGLVGKKGGVDILRSGRRSRLDATVLSSSSANTSRQAATPYIDILAHLAPDQRIDVLKVDIEGSEYALMDNFPDLFERSRVIALELHEAGGNCAEFIARAHALGLEECSAPILKADARLILLRNTRYT